VILTLDCPVINWEIGDTSFKVLLIIYKNNIYFIDYHFRFILEMGPKFRVWQYFTRINSINNINKEQKIPIENKQKILWNWTKHKLWYSRSINTSLSKSKSLWIVLTNSFLVSVRLQYSIKPPFLIFEIL